MPKVLRHFTLWCLGLAKAETQTTTAERACLAQHAAGKKRLVEIGCWHGVTTSVLRAAMAPEGVLFGVDPYRPGRLGFSLQRIIAHAEVSKIQNGSIRWLHQTGSEAARDFAARGEQSVDFIFIDGDHGYEGVRADWESWSPLVSTGGIVALHDSRSSPERQIEDAGSAVFTREVVMNDNRFEFVEAADTLTVMRRKTPR